MKKVLFAIYFLLIGCITADAQYFGRNKPRYRNFDFKVLETPHFKIHHYLRNEQMINDLAKTTEQWYQNHREIFGRDILSKNPIILYNNHAEFQQTNTISGEIGVGTGGVTEALKNRVVLPLTYSLQTTNHVLAHELVHAFQYNNIQTSDSTSLQSLANTPLWMVEGMAEYLSVGRIDPFTSMWMRDAILNNKLPEISKMNDYKYFPYRYGQALMAFLGGYYGDDKLNTMFMSSARYGLEAGFVDAFGTDTKTISNMWHSAMKTHYGTILDGKKEKPLGKKLISESNAGEMNVSPALSPNGKYVIFLSEKDVFNTDLYLADATKGTILNKVTSMAKSGSLDYMNVMESSGAWSPNSKDFVFVGIKKGKNVLVIKDADTGKTLETIEVSDLDAFINPVYHPNGKEIIVTGLMDGQPDLYSVNLKSKKAVRLTNDRYSENMANFSSDGTKLVFCYDKRSVDNGRPNGKYTYDIAVMDFNTKEIKTYDFFRGADNLNPVYDYQDNFYFVSDRDGLRNLYKYNSTENKVYQMTDLLTGISGISAVSPMITTSSKRDRVLYTHYYDSKYTIYEASSDELLNRWVEDTRTIDFRLGTLPVIGINKNDIVGTNFKDIDKAFDNSTPVTKSIGYSPGFKLDYIGGGGGVGVGVNNNSFRNATGLQGGVDLLFGDILGNHQLYSQVSLNGEILDIGGMVSYINRKNRFAWGVGISHVPLRTGFQEYENTSIVVDNGIVIPVLKESTNLLRIFDQSLSVFAHYPFSTTLRLEGGVAGTARSFRWDEYNNYYQPVRQGNTIVGYNLVASDKQRIATGNEIPFDQYYTVIKGYGANTNVGLVGDNSYFGLTSPLAGHRFRLSAEQYFGNDSYTAFLIDGRKYFRLSPFTLAVRSTNYLRFEKETNSVYPFFIGNMGFVRGLGSVISSNVEEIGLSFSQLIGSKMMLGGVELRLPFTGPRQLALIPSGFLLTDLNLFVDAGMAFDDFNEFSEGKERDVIIRDDNGNIVLDENGNPFYEIRKIKPTLVTTVGVSMRINLFGALIVEPYYAMPMLQGGSFRFGLNLIPGW
ncbi:MAG: PD40 domain-containing protein [Saprospiraceae bacterium]|nr:PD40 domain-containing protein [Saprospiraceae bacterium]